MGPLDRVLASNDGNVLRIRKGPEKTVKHSRNAENPRAEVVHLFYCFIANLEDSGRTWQSSPTLTPVGGFEQRVSTISINLVYFHHRISTTKSFARVKLPFI